MAKVLIVDDDRSLGAMVTDYLKHEKHEVMLVCSGVEGWQQIQSNQYDLIVLDWDLPDLAGVDILKLYRASGGMASVIMLTGHNSADDKERGLDTGANDYMTKPFNLKELAARVRACLRAQAAQAPVLKALGSGNEDVLEKGSLAGTALAAKYEFVDVIGEGGMGIVFKARHPKLDKLVAIKMLLSAQMSEEVMARFEREARSISRLDHPNIVVIHDYGMTERRQPFMVMDFIEGRSLEELIEEQEGLPLKEGLHVLVQVCDGLSHAHESGIVHRDVKPGNIILKNMGGKPPLPKILDFGLAKLEQSTAQNAIQLTRHGHAYGSPPYMSPEQVRGAKVVDERSDVYSMGCVVFETLTGFPPFTGETAMEIMIKRLEEPPYTFAETQCEVPYVDELQSIVSKALQIQPDDRYQTMKEMQEDLERVYEKVRSAAAGT
jgi:serine/threonine protein kinase/ActR/RegA family two-component response regulator